MILFAIDPGNIDSAYCVMNGQYELLEFAKLPNKEVMEIMLQRINMIDMVVIERMQSYGMPVGKETFEACEWIGRFSQEAEKYVPVQYIFRQEEKLWICHDTRAKDTNIRLALIERFAKHDMARGKGTKDNPDYFYGVKADCWSAIGIAVSTLDKKGCESNVKK